MSNTTKTQLNISVFTVIKIILVLLGFYVFYLIADVLALLFISFILFSAFFPFVDKLERFYIPRSFGVFIIYLLFFSVLSLFFVLFTPFAIEQTKELLKNLPAYLNTLLGHSYFLEEQSNISSFLDTVRNNIAFFQENMGLGPKSVFTAISYVLGGVTSLFVVLVLTFYMTVDKKVISSFVEGIFPKKYKTVAQTALSKIENKLGAWARAQLFLSFVIFLLTFIFLTLFQIKYALVLALIAGFTELIPYLGPILGAIPAVLLALSDSFIKALIVVAVYFVIQQFEGHVLVPQVMKKAVGLNPIISIIVLIAGFKIGGVLGGILAIPIAVAAKIIIEVLFTQIEEQKYD